MLWINLGFVAENFLRVFVLMRFFRACVGPCRVNRKLLAIFYVLLAVLGSLLKLSLPIQAILVLEVIPAFYAVEVLALLLVSCCYRGKVRRKIMLAALLPAIYWGAKMILSFACYRTAILKSEAQYLLVSVISTLFLGLLELVVERDRKWKEEQERERLQRELKSYENQFALIQQSQRNIRALKHDMKHHIKMLSDLISKDEKDAALKYLSNMGNYIQTEEEYVASGNGEIDSILNYMIVKAKKAGAQVEWKIQLPERLNISAFDINVILSNLLDNAINALTQVDVPILYISVKFRCGVLVIHIRNSCVGGILPREGRSVFSEDEHGLGLKNVKRIVEKYHGNVNLHCENEMFDAIALLFLPE